MHYVNLSEYFVLSDRHTGALEVYHAASLKFTPKLVYFAPPTYTLRKQLSVIDYTANKDREIARDNEGNEKTVRVYSRVSDTYHLRTVKAPKKDPHVRPLLEAAVRLRHRTSIVGEVHREGDPCSIFPYVHRGPGEWETKEALLASRAAHSRFRAMAAASHGEAAASVAVAPAPIGVAADDVAVASAPIGVAADDVAVAPAPIGVAADDVAVAPAPIGVAADDVAVAPAPIGVAADDVAVAPAVVELPANMPEARQSGRRRKAPRRYSPPL
ncbi:hypothetical protein FJT64_004285 [Amphibalanus amphitrite]|uniref:Uncharacterized protein n=1 Tax=Amphibalanus amphitrite TaxID=1232801 RepID=A0A6A4W8U7_AMPAM|nr:hypothetical protein FJT64_004285 [Amphibalanus amphitrite]